MSKNISPPTQAQVFSSTTTKDAWVSATPPLTTLLRSFKDLRSVTVSLNSSTYYHKQNTICNCKYLACKIYLEKVSKMEQLLVPSAARLLLHKESRLLWPSAAPLLVPKGGRLLLSAAPLLAPKDVRLLGLSAAPLLVPKDCRLLEKAFSLVDESVCDRWW